MSGAPITAYLLVTHGSRDRRPQEAMKTITQKLERSLQLRCSPFTAAHRGQSLGKAGQKIRNSPQDFRRDSESLPRQSPEHSGLVAVGHAVLELGPAALRSQILDFVTQHNLPSGSRLRILPLFLLAGVHVMEDIPEEIAAAQMQLGDRVELDVMPHFGSTLENLTVLLRQGQQQFMTPVPDRWILLAHGSRRSSAISLIENLAEQLDLKTAYWVQKESLQRRIEEYLADQSDSRRLTVGILPCFLFEGGMTDAIARQVLELGLQFPQVELRLGPTLGALPGFVERVQAALT